MTVVITAIVEGQGDVESVPVMVRRILQERDPGIDVKVHTIRIGRSKLLKNGELERAVELAAAKTSGKGAVIILLDADDDCAATLGPQLRARARNVRSDIPISVIIAVREFEAWFLAAASSLSGSRGLQADLIPPDDLETIRGAKEWLTARKTDGRSYSETLDQPAFAARFDLSAGRSAPSFARCCKEVLRLHQELQERLTA